MITPWRSMRGVSPAQRLDMIESGLERLMNDLRDSAAREGAQLFSARVTADYSARPWEIVLLDATGGAFTVLLPDPTSPTAAGALITLKNDSASTTTVTIRALGTSKTIDGAGTATISTARATRRFRSNGVEWKVL